MYGDIAYEERFEAAVKSKDTAVLCPSKPGAKGMTCRFMRKAAKTPVVKASRRAATQMEFKISPSAYDEARIAARRMHDLLSDGHETWREWLVRRALKFSPLPVKNSPLLIREDANPSETEHPTRIRPLYPRAFRQGPDKDMDGAWGFVGDGSHALTAAILMYRTGWCGQTDTGALHSGRTVATQRRDVALWLRGP